MTYSKELRKQKQFETEIANLKRTKKVLEDNHTKKKLRFTQADYNKLFAK